MVLPTPSVNETKLTAPAINYSEAEMAIMALSTTSMNILWRLTQSERAAEREREGFSSKRLSVTDFYHGAHSTCYSTLIAGYPSSSPWSHPALLSSLCTTLSLSLMVVLVCLRVSCMKHLKVSLVQFRQHPLHYSSAVGMVGMLQLFQMCHASHG